MLKDIRPKGTFRANDAAGRSHTLYVSVEILDAGGFEDPDAEMEGLLHIRTENGEHVNRLEKGRYQVLGAWEETELTSDDPAAP